MILFTPDSYEYPAEVAATNLAISHTPEYVAAVASVDDIIEAISFARERGMQVSVQAVGHTGVPITNGLMISTRRLNSLTIDPAAKTASVQAGVTWTEVVDAAAEHGLAPITGSSTTVSVVGYLMGGGLGPLVRSHGFSSDYLVSATVVLANGDVVGATPDNEQDLFWAIRGGKKIPGIVTDVTVRLVEMQRLYGGAIYFAENEIERVLRGWVDWTAHADPRVSTSLLLARFPDIDAAPPLLRGRRIIALRFAFPGPADEGQRLAAPLRALGPALVDELADMPATEIARIHNDPPGPAPFWSSGVMLSHADQEFASVVLDLAGPDVSTPFQLVEIRHLGDATAQDVPEGSAVAGRSAAFAFPFIAMHPADFANTVPAAAELFMTSLRPWTTTESNANIVGEPASMMQLASIWPAPIWAKLTEVRRRYDPDALFSLGVPPAGHRG